jgi:hypothetical protein
VPRKAPPKVKVALHKQPMLSAVVENGATVGATLGVDVYDENGNVVSFASLVAAAALAVSSASPADAVGATTWPLILDIPPNVEALADIATDGIYVITGAGTSATRELTVAAPSAASLSIVNPDGIAGDPLFIVDPTLNALAAANWIANGIPVGTGADTVAQLALAANTFPARSSAGNVAAKPLTDFALTILDDANGPAVLATIGAQGALNLTANTFYARGSVGAAANKTISDDALLLLADIDVPRLGTANAWLGDQSITGGITTTTNAIIGDYAAARFLRVGGSNSGVGGGGFVAVDNGAGSAVVAFGNTSAIIGGAYDGTSALYAAGGALDFFVGSAVVTQSFAANGDITVADVYGGTINSTNPSATRTALGFDDDWYTPTVTAGANAAAVTGHLTSWQRVGDTVTLSGRVDVTSTAASTYTAVRVSIPVASNFTAGTDVSGPATWNYLTNQYGAAFVNADPANNEIALNFISATVAGATHGVRFSVSYRVLP